MIRLSRAPGRPSRGRSLFVSALAVCASLAPACSSQPQHPSLVSTVSGSGTSGASNAGLGDAGASTSADAGAPTTNDAGAGGQSGETATSPGDDAGSGATSGSRLPPAVCSKIASWSDSVSVQNVSSDLGEILLSMTADELDLAFLRVGLLYVAHRATRSADFEIGDPIGIPASWTVAAGASLSGDGKRLLLSGDGVSKLGELTRSSRTAAFGTTVDTTAFSMVNQDAQYTGKLYAAPAVSPGDDQLFFNSAFPDGGSNVVVSTRKGSEPWSTPSIVSSHELDGDTGMRRLPNSVSSDALTLFYFNEESMQEEARWRDTAVLNSPLYDMMSLGERRGATPNSTCDRLYSEFDSDVVVEKD